ncbi:MAG: hypothetical protein L0312_12500, partial [Acidobacteria bacterium]|nr:hypothetical protein [Acidobacteriota bacterium]
MKSLLLRSLLCGLGEAFGTRENQRQQETEIPTPWQNENFRWKCGDILPPEHGESAGMLCGALSWTLILNGL